MYPQLINFAHKKNKEQWLEYLHVKKLLKETSYNMTATFREGNTWPVFHHLLLLGTSLPSLSHGSQTWLIKFHFSACCNYTHKTSICVYYWCGISKATFYSKLKVVVQAEGLDDGHFVLVCIPWRCSLHPCPFPVCERSTRRYMYLGVFFVCFLIAVL